jgi:DNA-binding NarL/FixJ family response regulator
VLIVDDHPAMRAGLTAVFEQEPDIVPVGAAPGDFEARPMYEDARPDVVLVDFHLPGQSSLHLTRHLKSKPLSPGVIIYSAHAGPALALGAALAGADAVISKEADARTLVNGIRMVSDGHNLLPDTAELLLAAADHLNEEDLQLTALLLHGSSIDEIALLHRVERTTVRRHLDRILETLEPEPAAT